MSTFKQAKTEAWEFYDTWRKVHSYSPALKCKVIITLRGWRHIANGTGAKKRNAKDTHRRFLLLRYAREIIEVSTTIQNVSTRFGNKYFILESVVNFESEPLKVRVVIEEDIKGNKKFLSVMGKRLP